MTDKEKQLEEALNRLSTGDIGTRKEWQWNHSFWMSSSDNIAKSKEAKEKMSKAQKKTAKSEKWRKSRSKYMTGRPNPEHSKRMKGKGNHMYGRGNMYIEVTTGFKGTATDMQDKFGVNPYAIAAYAKNDRPMKSGICKGKHFRKID